MCGLLLELLAERGDRGHGRVRSGHSHCGGRRGTRGSRGQGRKERWIFCCLVSINVK